VTQPPATRGLGIFIFIPNNIGTDRTEKGVRVQEKEKKREAEKKEAVVGRESKECIVER